MASENTFMYIINIIIQLLQHFMQQHILIR